MSKPSPKGLPPSNEPKVEPAQPFETYLTGLPAWQAAALKAHANWPAGREITRAQFDKALDDMKKEVIK